MGVVVSADNSAVSDGVSPVEAVRCQTSAHRPEPHDLFMQISFVHSHTLLASAPLKPTSHTLTNFLFLYKTPSDCFNSQCYIQLTKAKTINKRNNSIKLQFHRVGGVFIKYER